MSDRFSVSGWLHRNALFLLGFAAFALMSAWWWQAVKVTDESVDPTTLTPAETVEVWVAARDLPAGMRLTRAELSWFATVKTYAKDQLPAGTITDENNLVDRWLLQALKAGEAFNVRSLPEGNLSGVPEAFEKVGLEGFASQGFHDIAPGSKVDLLAMVRSENKPVSFPLLLDVLVLKVEQAAPASETGSLTTLVVAVSQGDAQLLRRAKQVSAQLDALSCMNGSKAAEFYDIERIRLIDPTYQRAVLPGAPKTGSSEGNREAR